ncbi:MAG: pilus assembly protein PilM [Deltaproteobacteria bacterium]
MSSLGIYFGPKVISLVETEGKRLVNSVAIPVSSIAGSNVDGEKVPEQIKLGIVLKDKFNLTAIQSKTADIVLPGKDLIIRTFHMPILSAAELPSAVRFEAKKYIPFKVDDLVTDFQVRLDKAARKNFVLFVGIKKETLDKYMGAVNGLNLKINSVEYAGFGILRLLKLAKVREKGVVALVNVDLAEDDEVNFVVLEDGFPLFSRDITLTGDASLDTLRPVKADMTESLEKLKIELRISLDFYLRKFPVKNIQNVVFIAPDEFRQELETFIRERGLTPRFIECKKLFDRPVQFSSSFIKSYACSLSKTVKSQLTVDLLPAAQSKKKSLSPAMGQFSSPALSKLFSVVRFDLRFIVLGALILFVPHLLTFSKKQSVQQELNAAVNGRLKVASVSVDASLDQMSSVDAGYKEKIKALRAVLKKRFFLTPSLDSVPRSAPKGLWLSAVAFQHNNAVYTFTLSGSVYLGDSDKEMEAVHQFVSDLKNNQEFSRNFPEITLESMDQGQFERTLISNFRIVCRSQ